jgi:hypothetical protein
MTWLYIGPTDVLSRTMMGEKPTRHESLCDPSPFVVERLHFRVPDFCVGVPNG